MRATRGWGIAILFGLFGGLVPDGRADTGVSIHYNTFDLSVKSGITSGTLSKTDISSGTKTDYGFGGLAFMLGFNLDFAPKFGFLADVHVLTDPTSLQITRTGFDLSLVYHAFGGARRLAQDYGYFESTERQEYNISPAIRMGLHRYNAANTAAQVSLSGSVYDVMLGVQYRQDLNDQSSVAAELYQTVVSFAASLDGVVSNQTLLLFTYRFFL